MASLMLARRGSGLVCKAGILCVLSLFRTMSHDLMLFLSVGLAWHLVIRDLNQLDFYILFGRIVGRKCIVMSF